MMVVAGHTYSHQTKESARADKQVDLIDLQSTPYGEFNQVLDELPGVLALLLESLGRDIAVLTCHPVRHREVTLCAVATFYL